MKKYELLAPAGDIEKLKAAFHFGADACYFAGKKWGLRAFSANFERDELADSIAHAHAIGKKAYITVNIQAHNKDFEGLSDYILELEKAGADAVIVSDAGVLSLIKQVAPKLPVHLSTQACASNKYAVRFWHEAGAKRVILARELTVAEIAEIHAYVPEVELEVFVHGAMCISYSGRCLLSNYLAGRDSNRGECVQSCRWEYSITEKSRPGQHLEIQEDNRGTYILNSKDLCLIQHLDKLAAAGATSFKIEGRMKSAYYVASVTNAYRRALDLLEKGKFKPKADWLTELNKSSNRTFTTGFMLGSEECRQNSPLLREGVDAAEREAKQGRRGSRAASEDGVCSETTINLDDALPHTTHDFVAVVLEETGKDGFTLIEQRNRFKTGETLEVLSSGSNHNKNFVVGEMKRENGEPITDALRVQEKLYIKLGFKLKPMDMLRKQTQ
ncbi:MAG: U32 family peptidase [Firmicutes bacterium]|nr:U32 family peptidase [Bacillota bacterium]